MLKTNLAVLMAERGLKIADVYEDTGISKTTLMAISENTGKGVQFDTVDKLCIYLGVTPQDFFSYLPFTWTISTKKSVDPESDFENIVINIKNRNSEKDYFIHLYPRSIDDFAFPVDNKGYKAWIEISIEETDAYSPEEFMEILKSMPISFEALFKKELIGIVKELVSVNNKKIHPFLIEKRDTIELTLKKGDKILLQFFNGYYNDFKTVMTETFII